ncbi:MAG: hypothetical protein NWF08_05565 [Candidatus Bathyarchaeota archaeon]|nr:hypothetical protein [Candidatus Bathyarchaeota archaeon]
MRSNSTSPVHEWLEWGQYSLAAIVVGAVAVTLVAFILIFLASRTEPVEHTLSWSIISTIVLILVFFLVLRKRYKK